MSIVHKFFEIFAVVVFFAFVCCFVFFCLCAHSHFFHVIHFILSLNLYFVPFHLSSPFFIFLFGEFFFRHFVHNTKSEILSFGVGRQHDDFYQSDRYVIVVSVAVEHAHRMMCAELEETTIVSFRQKLTIINTAIVIILFSLNCPEHFSPLFACRWCVCSAHMEYVG